MDLTWSPQDKAFRAQARAWLSAHVPRDPLPSCDTHRRGARVTGICQDRVVVVTGAGQGLGLGREHALAPAAEGARVVVNDLGQAARSVAEEIVAAGGTALADAGDVSDWAYAESLVRRAVTTFGTLDALVNNAGVNRDRMPVSMSEAEWDVVLKADLKGHARHRSGTRWRAGAHGASRPCRSRPGSSTPPQAQVC